MAKTVKFFLNGFGLRLASGGSEAQVERRLERSRSATPLPSRRRKPAAVAANLIVARDERSFCGAEQTCSRGKGGDRQVCGAKKNERWSRRSKNSME